MVDIESLGGMLSQRVSEAGVSAGTKYMTYVGWIIYAIIIFGGMALVYFWYQFRYKLTILEGSISNNKDGTVGVIVRKVKKDRAMPIKDRGVKKWRLLFNWNRRIEPVPFEYILPGNHIFLFRTSPDTFNPMKVPTVSNPTANFVIDPFDASFFNLGVQQDARDYQKDDVMRKQQIMLIATVVLCLAALVFVTWICMKYVGKTADKIEFAAAAWEGLKGVAPR